MNAGRQVLVIGAGGCLGRAVVAQLGAAALVSSRDPAAPVFVDLEAASGSWRLPAAPEGAAALLLAARTDTGACEREPEAARCINVTATLELARRLVELGYFLVFPSSSQVFDGTRPQPAVGDPASPATVYGKHKAEVETGLLARHPAQAAVVRLGKVLDGTNGLIQRWAAALLRGEAVEAFSDMRMAPVTEAAAAAALLDAAGHPGIHHFSAARDLSYEQAARLGASVLGADPGLVCGVSCAGRGLFAPRHTALAMTASAPDPETAVSRAFLLTKAELA